MGEIEERIKTLQKRHELYRKEMTSINDEISDLCFLLTKDLVLQNEFEEAYDVLYENIPDGAGRTLTIVCIIDIEEGKMTAEEWINKREGD